MLKVAVITPYYKEKPEVLMKCHESVVAQTHKCDHFLVADGHPNPIFANHPHHMILPHANGDNGNTPRAFGGLLAESLGYDAVAYLDADNWYLPNHIANLVSAFERHRTPLICSKRLFCDLDGNMLNCNDPDDDANRHVDTSCWLVTRPGFSMLKAWLMPKILGPYCDRIFFQKARHDRFAITFVNEKTMVFRSQYKIHYYLAGREAPPNVKGPNMFEEQQRLLSNRAILTECVAKLGFMPDVQQQVR